MFRCLWNGREIRAGEVAETFDVEKTVREAAERNELICADKDCDSPLLCYKHGDQRAAHFAHKHKGNCDYADFDRNDTDVVRAARVALFNVLKSKGCDVSIEVKIPNSRKYAHLLITDNGKQTVVQIADESITPKKMDALINACAIADYSLLWIIISDPRVLHSEDTHHSIRSLYSKDNTVVLLSKDIRNISISKRYNFSKYMYSTNFDYFLFVSSIADLSFEKGVLTLSGFQDKFNEWVAQRKREIEEKQARVSAIYNKPKAIVPIKAKVETPVIKTVNKRSYKDHFLATGELTKGEGRNVLHIHYAECPISTGIEFSPFDSVETMRASFEKIEDGIYADFASFLNRICRANRNEKAYYVALFREYNVRSDTPKVIIDVLRFIADKAGIQI